MTSTRPHFSQRLSSQATFLVAMMIIVGLIVGVLVADSRQVRAHRVLDAHMAEVMALQKETIFGLQDKYRLMTALIARQRETVAMFLGDENAPRDLYSTNSLESFTSRLSAMSSALRVRLAYPDGKIIALSNPNSTINEDVSEYIEPELLSAALQNRLGRTTIRGEDGQAVYAFAAAVRAGKRTVGIVVVDLDLQILANAWALSSDLIFVTDNAGNFIIGNQLADQLPPQFKRTYDDQNTPIPIEINGKIGSFLARSERLEFMGWHISVLEDYAPAQQARSNAIIITLLFFLVVTALAFILLQNRHAILARLALERRSALMLEERVQDRTKKLTIEIDERVTAERALKRLQAKLIQSAKLAAIGHMSTALAHEYNQPLAAIRTYADNARSFLAKEKVAAADDNLERIAKMTERMAELSRTLKSFARTPRSELQPVELQPLFDEALILVGPAAKAENVKIIRDDSAPGLVVMAGHVRLSQVILNLLSNAIDAVSGRNDRRIFLGAKQSGDQISIKIEDTGPGVPHDNRHTIFDAFVTDKEVGKGLGLGLSIAYNIVSDFDGEIAVGESKKGGAEFTILLPRAIMAKHLASEKETQT